MKIVQNKVVYAFSEIEGEIPSLKLVGVFIEGDECPQAPLRICNDVPEKFSSLKGDELRKAMESYAKQNQGEILRKSISANHIATVHPSR